MKKLPVILLLVLLFLFCIGAAAMITMREAEAYYTGAGASTVSNKVNEVMDYFDQYFIADYDENKMADMAAAGICAGSGDRWTSYLSAEDYQNNMQKFTNAYGGVGLTVTVDDETGELIVTELVPGGPAELAGVQIGDVLYQADGQLCSELGLEQTVALVKGELGTSIRLVFRRDGATYEADITRAEIPTPVSYGEMLENDIGYVYIANFEDRCAEETLNSIDSLLEQGAKGLIFDLRFNGGGQIGELTEILDRLLPEGTIISTEDYAGTKNEILSDADHVELPMIVLVNEHSYSAAEFFACALQEYGIGEVIGEKTCGKGYFQYGFELSDGSYLHLSVGKYYTPQGRSLIDVGVTPDIEVELSEDDFSRLYYGQLDPEDDEQLQAAITEMNAKIS